MGSGVDRARQLREMLATQPWVMGTAVTLEDPTAIEIAAVAGYDYVRIEREHSPVSDSAFIQLLRAADAHDMPVLVRVPDASTKSVLPCLEGGAAGILVAHVSTPADAQAAVREARFPPLGGRSVYTKSRAARFGGVEAAQYIQESNANIIVGLLIEDSEGVDNAREMAAVEGVDFLAIGRYDYAASIGHMLRADHPDVAAAEDAIVRAAHDAGKMASLSVHSPKQLQSVFAKGVRFLLTDADNEAMLRAWKERLDSYRSLLGGR